MLCHFFKLSRPAPLSPVPASFKLLPSFHLFPFLLTYSAHAIGRWATGFKFSGLGLKSFGHMHAHGLSTCALVHTYTWDMSIRQRLVSHGLCLRSTHGPCSCVRCYQLQLWFTLCVTLPTCWTFLLACPTTPPSHSQRVLFWKRRLDQPDTILTLLPSIWAKFPVTVTQLPREGAVQSLLCAVRLVTVFPIARVISCYEFCSPLGIIRSMPLRNKMFSDRSIPDPNQN